MQARDLGSKTLRSEVENRWGSRVLAWELGLSPIFTSHRLGASASPYFSLSSVK